VALGNFELDIERFVKKANGNIDLVVRKVALDVFSRCIQKSPVDTGRFKSNWQVSIGSIPSGTIGVPQKGDNAAERSATSGNESLMRVTAAIPNYKAGQVIYLVNNLAYARALEYGHSKQAPNGMIRLTVSEYGAIVSKATSEVPK